MSYGLTKHQNPEIAALEAQWWKDWYAQDFSWDGLKTKTCQQMNAPYAQSFDVFGLDEFKALGQTSLAEIWHDEDPYLIPEPGTNRQWTRLHCPYVFADGTPSPKAGWGEAQWETLENIIIAIANEPAGRSFIWLNGAVIRAGFQGVFSELPEMADVRLDWAHVKLPLSLSGSFRSLGANHVWFADNVVAPSGNFRDAHFADTVFSRDVIFGHSRFDEDTSFARARFLRGADFSHTQFTSTAMAADFSGAQFGGMAEFPEVRFAHEAMFNGVKFAGRTNFYATAFEDRALFDDIECLENIHFYKAAFVRRLTINRAIFYRKLNLEGITDGDPIGLSPQPLTLSATETEGKPSGLSGELKPSVGPTTQSYHVLPKLIAEGAVFHYDANFSNRDIISPSTFENARFYHWARFHGSTLHPNVSLHNTRFDTALGYRPSGIVTPPDHLLRLRFASLPDQSDFNAWKKAFLKARLETHKAEFSYNSFYDGLEASYRTLKQTMEDRRDRIREGQFFMYELRARRKRHDVPLWETAASWIYWGASDYGNSIFRPLILMAVMFVGLALVYFGMAEKAIYTGTLTFPLNPDLSARLTQAFGFSLNNTFSPFSALDASKIAAKDEWTSALLMSPDRGFSLKIKAIATVQSLLTLTLAFLAGLAGRRRFQIN